MRITTLGITLLATGLLGTGASAQDPSATPGPSSSRPQLHGELALSLQEAIAMAIENNLDVEVARHDPFIAEEEADGSWGAYDPTLFADWTYASNQTPDSNPLTRGDPASMMPEPLQQVTLSDRSSEGAGGLRGLVPKLGSTYELTYSGSSRETSTGFFSLNPEYRTNVQAIATQPLLKDFLWNAPWVSVKTSAIFEDIAGEGFRLTLMDTVSAVERAYWDVVASTEGLRVAEKSLETAEALLEQTRTQYEVGVVSRVEVVEAEAGVADRRFTQITVQNQLETSQDRLIDLVLGPNLRPTSMLELRPTDSPEPLPYDVDPQQAADVALEYRPEISTARKEIEQREILAKFARNQRLPQLDVVGSYGFEGLAGKANSLPSPFSPGRLQGEVPRSYSGADDDFLSAEGARSWAAGAVFSFPLGNRRARADANVADLELRRARTVLRRTEQNIILEVRQAVRNLRSTLEGIEASEERRRATAEQVRAEKIRLEHGESTPFEVLDREEDLVDAERQKIVALRDYRDSLTALDRAQGTILRNRSIVVDTARPLR